MRSFSKEIFLLIAVVFSIPAMAQFAPAAGMEGTSAISKDSSDFIDWAESCFVSSGYINIADTNQFYEESNKANFGEAIDATQFPDNIVVSLGDGGEAILTFAKPIVNGQGNDFAVFENSFNNTFLELAFVEVSSDGINYFRFPSSSQTQTASQIESFGELDAVKLNNLAGKYRGGYGTPFDLEELKDKSNLLDINNITHVKVVDVVGCIDCAFGSFDSNGNKVNDPWPTAFWTGGFDLDAVGVIHNSEHIGIDDNLLNQAFQIYPNPSTNFIKINNLNAKISTICIVDLS